MYYKEKYWDVDQTDSAQWIERGPVRAVFETRKRFLHSSICQRIIFYAHTARIDFATRVDWQQSQLLLKTLFPVSVNANQAAFDIQFGNVQRPTHYNTSWDTARYETCAHKWADLSEDGFGVSLLNNCKYGYDVHEGILALTLIKSGIEPNPVTDREEHTFTYSLYPHTGGWREGGTVQEAEMLNAPLMVRPASGTGANRSLFTPDADNVLVDAVKLAEDNDGIILRLHEFKNRRGGVSLACAGRVLSAVECNLLEDPVGDVEVQGRTLFFSVAPYEIKTFRIRMDRPE